MCGIAGYAGPRPLAPDRIAAGLRALHHRGPDHAASRTWRTAAGTHVTLLHTRLSIIDLDPRAHQPLQAGSSWLACNGELYNYVELRAALEREGARFATSSDTEVLLRAIRRWGWEALDRCEGMWAFALFDEADGSLTICRDRFGEKPLYLYHDAMGFYFGSEVKAIAALIGYPLTVNTAHLYRYLVNGYKALYKTRETFFEGVEELPPASWLRVEGNGPQIRGVYWRPQPEPNEAMSWDEAVAGTRERLMRSVELRLRADVPLAFCMSGGVDSNALISIAKKVFGYDVHGFTIMSSYSRGEQDYETGVALASAAALKIRHSPIYPMTEGFLDDLRALVRQHDAPVLSISYFVHWRLMEAMARAGYRIAVSGTAADELFTGYYDHHLAYLYEVRGEPALHAASREAWLAYVQPVVRNPYLQDADAFLSNPKLRDHIFLDAPRLSGYLKVPWSEPFAEERYTEDLLRNRMLNELFHEIVPVILHEDDLNAMACSIENRSPYLDRELFEFAYRIPTRHLIREGRAKAVLREAAKDFLPEPVLAGRRKVGFNAPLAALLNTEDGAVRRRVLDESPIYAHVRRDAVEALLDGSCKIREAEHKFLFNFLNSKLFLEECS